MGEPHQAQRIHLARGAGRWFPGTRQELERIVDACLEKARVARFSSALVGGIAPHAGFVYSGPVAGYTFRALADNCRQGHVFETVVVLGFCHRESFTGIALLDADVLRTPLGDAPLDREGAAFLLRQNKSFLLNDRPHATEHSAENQVPFLQRALPNARLIVGLLGDHNPETILKAAEALFLLADQKPVFVLASTDLLHDPDDERVARTDRRTLELIAALDSPSLIKAWSYETQVCCGIGPVLAVMEFARRRGCTAGTTLCYRNSAEDFPESRGNWVVGYGSAVFEGPENGR